MVQSILRTAQKLGTDLNNSVRLKNLEQYLTKAGWEIKHFDDEAFRLLKRTEIAAKHQLFVYCRGDLHIVFVDFANMTISQAASALLHEICHIALEHHLRGITADYSRAAEREANMLSGLVRLVIFWRQYSKQFIIGVILLLVLMLGAISTQNATPSQPPEAVPDNVSTTVIANTDVQYYRTPSGNRYHIISCSHLKNREYAPVTQEDIAFYKLLPCKDCIEDE
ncbi:MAG TPA: hypothetical protein IAB00_00955 [Candidatus Avidehalobacter gallistercoris]|uniref:Uncharacterized protein n=1 Tax=Candidatus Avidehalobacter gallistercoris TaxID=2840694 RepID=A0A9D1HIS4_9FIRM|nr:hypothetical protein [Candidatus Avidehalobacter gallistercoris]